MSGELTQMIDFRFSSLRKYMQPLYFSLNRHLTETKERKQEVVRKLVPEFFHRMREHRNISLEDIAAKTKLSVATLEGFESGTIRGDREVEDVYCRLCHGENERAHFMDRVHEFMNPSVRETREAIAKDSLRRYGLVIPGVDYANLGTPRGKVLNFPAR